MPRAKAELISTLRAQLHDVRALWTIAGAVGMVAYFVHVPIAALIAELELRWEIAVPLISVGLATPFMGAIIGDAHAKLLVRRRLPALLAAAATHHGASAVELEPEIRDEVAQLLRSRDE